MKTAKIHSNAIRILLKKQEIATLDELKVALGTNAPATVFRKLKELDVCTTQNQVLFAAV